MILWCRLVFLAGFIACLPLPSRTHDGDTISWTMEGDLRLDACAQVFGPANDAVVGADEFVNYATQAAHHWVKITNTGTTTLTDIEFTWRRELLHNTILPDYAEGEGPVTLEPNEHIAPASGLSCGTSPEGVPLAECDLTARRALLAGRPDRVPGLESLRAAQRPVVSLRVTRTPPAAPEPSLVWEIRDAADLVFRDALVVKPHRPLEPEP